MSRQPTWKRNIRKRANRADNREAKSAAEKAARKAVHDLWWNNLTEDEKREDEFQLEQLLERSRQTTLSYRLPFSNGAMLRYKFFGDTPLDYM